MKRFAVAACLALSVACCGGGDSGGSPSPTPTPTPAPTPSPTATPSAFDPALSRLRAGVAAGAPLVRAAQAVDVVIAASTAWPDGVKYGHSDPKLRWLGGRSIVGGIPPWNQARVGTAITNGDPSVLGGNGLPANAYARNNGVRFVLPGGQRTFELAIMDAGARDKLDILVDGQAVLAEPVPFSGNAPGGELIARITLPASNAARTIQLDFGWRPLIGVNLPSGQSLLDQPAADPLHVVFIGDSITEGAVATANNRTWVMQASFRLGIGDPVISAVGGSGYVQRNPADTGYNFNDRLNDAVRAFDSKAPDAVVVAGGINDCMFERIPSAQVGAAARTYFTALRSALPGTPIFVVGPWTDWNNPGADNYETALGPCRNAIFGAGEGIAGLYTIDTTNWVTLANRDTIFNGYTFGPHPIDGGHAYYGQKVAEAMAAILATAR